MTKQRPNKHEVRTQITQQWLKTTSNHTIVVCTYPVIGQPAAYNDYTDSHYSFRPPPLPAAAI